MEILLMQPTRSTPCKPKEGRDPVGGTPRGGFGGTPPSIYYILSDIIKISNSLGDYT